MKKLLIFPLLISMSLYAGNPTPQQLFQMLQKKQQELLKQLNPEVRKKIEEEQEKIALNFQEKTAKESLADLQARNDFVLSFDVVQVANECKKTTNPQSCLSKLKNFRKQCEEMSKIVEMKAETRTEALNVELVVTLMKKYPEDFIIFAELMKVEHELSQFKKN